MTHIKSVINYCFAGFYALFLSLYIYISRNNIQSNIITSERISWMILFILLGISGVFPMIISLKQGGFYFLTALPYFSISFVILIIPILNYILNRFSVKRVAIYVFMPALFILYGPFISYSSNIVSPFGGWKLNSLKYQYERVGRDRLLLDDIKLILMKLPKDAIVNIDFQRHYIIRGYFARHGNISLDTDQINQHKYLISFENGWSYKSERNAEGRYLQAETIFQKNRKLYKKNYEKIELNTNKLHLYTYKK